MRDLFKKLAAVSMVAGAALAVSACGKTETANTTDNTAMSNMSSMEGSMNDSSAMSMGNDMGAMGNMGGMDNSSMSTDMNASGNSM